MVERWEPNRAGFLNFWYYDTQEFQFVDGKLLLRGSNGSGKSVTMQSLVPVLLDGRTSADRLDPFGSRARRMEDYLLDEVSNREERTGYLWLEFKRQQSERYITCGIGLRARRHATLEFWGFVITDDRRIGEGFHLHKKEPNLETGKEEIVPLSKRELSNRLQTGGRVVETRREYMELVNRHVFGFEPIDAYDDLIKLLIQLRSPKLSKDFKPTVIYEILNAAMPPLSEEELRPLSETIENMDQIKQQLEQLQRDEQAMKRLAAAYDNYNRWQLAALAKHVLDVDERCNRLKQDEAKLRNELQSQHSELTAVEQRLENLKLEHGSLQSEQKQLQEHEVSVIGQRHLELEQTLSYRQQEQVKKQESLSIKERHERETAKQLGQQEAKVDQLYNELEELVEELVRLAETAAFVEHHDSIQHWQRTHDTGQYDFSLWNAASREHFTKLEKAMQSVRDYTRAQQQYSEADRAHGDASKVLDDKRSEQRHLVEGMDQLKEEYLSAFDAWTKQLQEVQLTQEERQMVTQRVVDIYEPHLPATVIQPAEQAWRRVDAHLTMAELAAKSEIRVKDDEITQLQAEIRKWREQAEPEPARHPDTEVARQALTMAGVPYVPLFAAVEFRDGVSEEQKERMEAAISEAGLLDALIVPDQHLSVVTGFDKVIIPAPQLFALTLADVLQPVPGKGVDGETIDNVLRSILCGVPSNDPGAVVLDTNGRYRIALLSGQAPKGEGSRFIGQEARRQYRARVLQRLGSDLEALKLETSRLQAHLQTIQQRKGLARQEYDKLPALTALDEQWQKLWQVGEELRVREAEVRRHERRVAEEHRELQAARNRLQMAFLELNLEASEPAVTEAFNCFRDYQSGLHKLELKYQAWSHSKQLVQQYNRALLIAQADVDELKGELNALEFQLKQLRIEIASIERQLVEMGAEEIRARIAWVGRRLLALPQEREDASRQIADLQGEIRRGVEDVSALNQRLSTAQQLRRSWLQLFLHELSLGFVKLAGTEDPIEQARRVLKETSQTLQQSDGSRAVRRLQDAFHVDGSSLVEYLPVLIELHKEIDIPALAPGDEQYLLERLQESRMRLSLTLEYKGRKTDIYHVLETLQQDMLEQQHLLADKDRELYEDIILKSVGDMIRRRISRAEQWVEKISGLMEQRDTSSGLTLSLVWKPRTAEHEDELDTKELVQLLMMDPVLLKLTDSERVTAHFRSQIDRAKMELAERRQGETFQAIVQELLDYRRWFDFKLFFRKEGEQRRELTDRIFFTFSGGEKAMAMYIPLFSAAYSRYQEAKEFAPRLISLDEAFAGVDETNIRDMFALMEQLEFDYIINSQALWGDYDAAGRLAISELVRPKNARCVTVVPYLWDGQSKHLLATAGGADLD